MNILVTSFSSVCYVFGLYTLVISLFPGRAEVVFECPGAGSSRHGAATAGCSKETEEAHGES